MSSTGGPPSRLEPGQADDYRLAINLGCFGPLFDRKLHVLALDCNFGLWRL